MVACSRDLKGQVLVVISVSRACPCEGLTGVALVSWQWHVEGCSYLIAGGLCSFKRLHVSTATQAPTHKHPC